MKRIILCALTLFSFSASALCAELEPYAVLSAGGLVPECSAWFKSRKYKGVYWTLNDSGNPPRIFAFTRAGALISPVSVSTADYKGILVRGARNRDWESMTADDSGNLIVCDAGNNRSSRRDLAVYVFPEPDPFSDTETAAAVKISFVYPDQENFHTGDGDFDSESCFWSGGKLYLLTKDRADSYTKVYAFPSSVSDGAVELKKLGRADVGGMATDATVSESGDRLAVLTYSGVRVFRRDGAEWRLSGKQDVYEFGAGQCEGISFSEDGSMLISNEDGKLFEVKISSFR